MFDGYTANEGWPLVFAYTFVATNAPGTATAVVVLRAAALPVALGGDVWEKYKIGELLKIIDPETKAPAVKNPFLHPKPDVLRTDDAAVDRLLANGAVIGACNQALYGMSKMLAHNAGVTADEAAKEWTANHPSTSIGCEEIVGDRAGTRQSATAASYATIGNRRSCRARRCSPVAAAACRPRRASRARASGQRDPLHAVTRQALTLCCEMADPLMPASASQWPEARSPPFGQFSSFRLAPFPDIQARPWC